MLIHHLPCIILYTTTGPYRHAMLLECIVLTYAA